MQISNLISYSNLSKICGNENEGKTQSAPNSYPATLIKLGGGVICVDVRARLGRGRPGTLLLRGGHLTPPSILGPSSHDRPSFIISGFSSLSL